jgi:hypothetical protein
LKALHSYKSDDFSVDNDKDENGFLNETFSKSSGNIVEEKMNIGSRFSEISSKNINKSTIRAGMSKENEI